jgi:hypothetical protein
MTVTVLGVLGSSGHLRVTVLSNRAVIDYIRAYRSQDEKSYQRNGQVEYSYALSPYK